VNTLRKCLKRFKFLQSIILTGFTCPIDLTKFIQSLQRLTSLRSISLDLVECDIEDKSFSNFSQSLQRFSSQLRSFSLNIVYCEISDECFNNLCVSLPRLSSLQSIELGFPSDALTDQNLRIFSDDFKSFSSSLQSLSLRLLGPNITEEGLRIFGENLKLLSSIQSISLGFDANNITDQVLKNLGESLQKVNSLKALDLHFRNCVHITKQGLTILGEILKTFDSLKSIRLIFRWYHPSDLQDLQKELEKFFQDVIVSNS